MVCKTFAGPRFQNLHRPKILNYPFFGTIQKILGLFGILGPLQGLYALTNGILENQRPVHAFCIGSWLCPGFVQVQTGLELKLAMQIPYGQ